MNTPQVRFILAAVAAAFAGSSALAQAPRVSGGAATPGTPTPAAQAPAARAAFVPNGSTTAGVAAPPGVSTVPPVNPGTGNPISFNPTRFTVMPDGSVLVNYNNAPLTPENAVRDANGNFGPPNGNPANATPGTGTPLQNARTVAGVGSVVGNAAATDVNGNPASTVVNGNVFPSNLAPGVVLGGVATVPALDPGQQVDANGERVVSLGGVGSTRAVAVVPSAPQPSAQTPIYDMATRAATARDASRRARGDTPRIFGIAPRTENDRTDQIPDDRIIRY